MAKGKRSGCTGCAVVGLGGIVLLMLIGRSANKGPQPQPQEALPADVNSEAKQDAIHSGFELVGYFKSGSLRGFTYFVSDPNKQDLEEFCGQQKTKFPTGRVLKIHFFDDRQQTPDVTNKYEFPESSDAYLVADYTFNPTGETQLNWHKEIPENPTPIP